MIRKVSQIGPVTLMVSLPSKWAKKYNVKKGNEVNIEEKGNELILSTRKRIEREKKEIDISNLGVMARRAIGATYKAGYNDIKVLFNEPSKLELVQKEVSRSFLGFEIVQNTNKYCIIKELASIEVNEIDNNIRRTFRLLIENATDTLNAAKKFAKEELLVVASRDITVNKFADLIRRTLIDKGYPRFNKTAPIYYIIEELERIGDEYRELALYIAKNNVKLNDNILSVFEDVNKYLEEFYDLFYDYKDTKMAKFGEDEILISDKIENLFKESKKQEIIAISYLKTILQMIFDMNGSLFTAIL